MAKKALVAMVVSLMVGMMAVVPAFAQQTEGDTVVLGFELAVEGQPPMEESFYGLYGLPNSEFNPVQLADADEDGVYTGSVELEPGEYVAQVAQGTYSPPGLGSPSRLEVIRDFGTVALEEDTILSASVSFGGGEPEGPEVEPMLAEATGVIEQPETTAYMYGTHAITDEASGTRYALRSEAVDLDGYLGRRVSLEGSVVYAEGEIEGGPALLAVTHIEPAEEAGETVTLTYELEIKGEVPGWQVFSADRVPRGQDADAGLCSTDPGYLETGNWERCETGGVYTGSVEVPVGIATGIEFTRQGADAPEVFFEDTRTPTEDTTVSATYDFGTGGETPGGETTTGGGETPVLESIGEDQYGGETTDSGADLNEDGAVDGEDGAVAAQVSDAADDGEKEDEGSLTLPDTGGVTLLLALAGALLVVAGLVIRRLAR